MQFSVPGMSCGHCTAAIEKSVTAADPAAAVACDLDSHSVTIDSKLTAEALAAAIKAAGYDSDLVAA